MQILILIILLTGCSTAKEDVKPPSVDLSKVKQKQSERIEKLADKLDEGKRLKHLKEDCDGFLWQGKFCAATGCRMSDYEEAGRLFRRPSPRCWEGEDRGSKTTWSRDMAVCGLIPLVLLQKDYELMKRHIDYGDKNNWLMGEPKKGTEELSRITYTPGLISLLFDVEMWARTNKASTSYDFYTQQSLDDYQAHLQSCKIWAKMYMSQEFSEGEEKAIKKHYERVPDSPFYAFLFAQVTGNYNAIVEICEGDSYYLGDYIRCNGSEDCAIAEKVFSCELLIRAAND